MYIKSIVVSLQCKQKQKDMDAQQVLRYGNILVDIKTPYSNKRLYCVKLKQKYYEIVIQNGDLVKFIKLKRKPKKLESWMGLSFNSKCNKYWLI